MMMNVLLAGFLFQVLLVLPTMEARFNKTFEPSSVTFDISKKQSNYTLMENIENNRSSSNSIRNTHIPNITQININQLKGNTSKFELLTTTPRNPGEIPLKEKLTSDISRACPVYESVLPDGECVKYLGKHRVAQSPSEIILRNDKLKRFYGESWEFVQLWFLSGKPNKSFLKVWLGECYEDEKIKRQFDALVIPSLQKMQTCIARTKSSICHLYHPSCVYQNLSIFNNHSSEFKYFNRQLCRESCVNLKAKTGCNDTIDFFEICAKIITGCPKLKISKQLSVPGCGRLLPADIKHIEKCFLLKKSDLLNISSLINTNSCYVDDGQSYRGKMSVTKSGKNCVRWIQNPYLSTANFPELEENYCRNPQGYGLRPWCYVDVKNRKWEYCHIEICKSHKSDGKADIKNGFLMKHDKELIIICVSIVLLGGMITFYIFVKVKIKTFKKEKQEIPCYNEISLKSSEEVADHMRDSFHTTSFCESDNSTLSTPWIQEQQY